MPVCVVDQQQLVVHALVEAEEAAQDVRGEFERRRRGLVERRVVQAQFEVRMRAREPRQQRVVVDREQLVGEHAHLARRGARP